MCAIPARGPQRRSSGPGNNRWRGGSPLMSFPTSEKIWMNGKLVAWDDARIHLGSHVIHYGSAVFEGLRCYSTPEGSAIFRLDIHTERLYNSARIYRMDVPYTADEFNQAVIDTVAANHMDACYIRP